MKKITLDKDATQAQSSDLKVRLAESSPGTASTSKVVQIFWPAVHTGALLGLTGFIIGGFAGVLRSTSPTLFALGSGVQWFTLGSAYSASKGTLLLSIEKECPTSQEKVYASTLAGGVAGTFGGLLRGPRNIIPGAIVFATWGAGGQALYNSLNAKKQAGAETAAEKRSWWESKWSPISVLSDEAYKEKLEESLLSINARLLILDEDIKALIKKQGENNGDGANHEPYQTSPHQEGSIAIRDASLTGPSR